LSEAVLPAYLQDEESRETKRLAALEEKSKLYERMQRGVDLEDEAGNSRHEVLNLTGDVPVRHELLYVDMSLNSVGKVGRHMAMLHDVPHSVRDESPNRLTTNLA